MLKGQKGQYHFGVKGRGKSLNFINKLNLSNLEDLTGDKILYFNDPPYQDLNPNGGDRVVVLNGKSWGEITNNSDGTNSLSIKETVTGGIAIVLSNVNGYKAIFFRKLIDESYLIKVIGTY